MLTKKWWREPVGKGAVTVLSINDEKIISPCPQGAHSQLEVGGQSGINLNCPSE